MNSDIKKAKVYTLGLVREECCGHGDYRDIMRISQKYDPGVGDYWPPVFDNRRAAEDYFREDLKWPGRVIVELDRHLF